MGISITPTEIKITRELSELDNFVLDVAELIEKYSQYVIVSGYVTILFGRSRGTEDVDFVIEKIPKEGFMKFCRDAQTSGFEFINPEDCSGLYEMLKERLSIRMAREGEIIPNAEIKFPKDFFHQEALKKSLGSDKDIEDAYYLYELFKENLNRRLLHDYIQRLGVEMPF